MEKDLEELRGKSIEELRKDLALLTDEKEEVRNRYAKRMADNKTKFDAIFAQIWKIEPREKNASNPFASTDEITAKAIEAAKLNGDSEVIAAFKAHQNDYQSFYEMEAKAIDINLQIAALSIQQKRPLAKADEWQFAAPTIIAPQKIMEEIIAPMMLNDAKKGKGLFQNVSNIEEESEDEDSLLMVKMYNCEASLTKFWEELKQFGVIGRGKEKAFFGYDFRRYLLILLNELATFIGQNTDKPAKTKNKIARTIKEFDKVPIWGLFFQILILQGLCRWLEGVDINKGDNGFDEAQSLYDWLCWRLIDKETRFCYTTFGNGDKERLKPFCKYLYSTDIGRKLQAYIFGDGSANEPQQESDASKVVEPSLPSELERPEVKKYLDKARELGLIDGDYKWLKSKQLLACFAADMSHKLELGKGLNADGTSRISWKPCEILFKQTNLRSSYNDVQKTGQLPIGYKLLNYVFGDK
jgi:hypothetical protein